MTLIFIFTALVKSLVIVIESQSTAYGFFYQTVLTSTKHLHCSDPGVNLAGVVW
jgi:hypothetical protein